MNFYYCVFIAVSFCVALFSYLSVLTLIRAKEEDSGNYTIRVENGEHIRDVGLNLEVKGKREECPKPFITFMFLDTAVTTFWPSYSLSFPHIFTHTLSDYVTVPAVILDLMDIHHGSAKGQAVVCITRGQPTPVVEWFVCKNIKQ